MNFRHPKIIGIHAKTQGNLRLLLASLPFFVLIVMYLIASDIKLKENPDYKLLPSVPQMIEEVNRVGFTINQRTEKYDLWEDTYASMKRIVIATLASTVFGLLLGLNLGVFPGFQAIFKNFLTFFSIIPPLAVLPILFIVFGVGELSKGVLIFIGAFPVIAFNIFNEINQIPREQIIKCLTLGASELQVAYRIILPQLMPRLISSVRLILPAVILFLIASEGIASDVGLGYRIYLQKRYMNMALIIPYVLWITFLAYMMDYILKTISTRCFAWYENDTTK